MLRSLVGAKMSIRDRRGPRPPQKEPQDAPKRAQSEDQERPKTDLKRDPKRPKKAQRENPDSTTTKLLQISNPPNELESASHAA